MDSLQTQDGQHFIRSLAQFIRQHEKALANSLQLTVHRRQTSQNGITSNTSHTSNITSGSGNHTSTSTLASALSFAGLNFNNQAINAAHLTLTPHHLFYLLSRIEDLNIAVGPMNVRIESIHSEPSQSNYVSFLQTSKPPSKGRSDGDSIHSVSSVRSVMSGMSAFWSSIGLGHGSSKSEKAKAAAEADLKYLYSAFTKLPSLRLTADPRARLIQGYEEFPFDTAVPLFAFKNVQQLDIVDMDFRQFHGWDRLADQLCLLTLKRAHLDDPLDLLTNIVLDDAERRRRRSTKNTSDAPSTPSWTVPSTPSTPHVNFALSHSDTGSPEEGTPVGSPIISNEHDEQATRPKTSTSALAGSVSPKRPNPVRPASSYRHARSYSAKMKRSGSGSSNSSDYSSLPFRSESTTNIFSANILPASKWQRLKYLSLADNGLTSISSQSLIPLTSTLRSLNLSSNLFTEIPDSLASLTRLTSLDLSNCMIESLQSLTRSPLPAITTIKLKSNRLQSLAGIERLLSLENLHVQDNLLSDPMEAARLTGIPNLRRIWVKQNPFTKTYSDYRVKIMNLFRQTPGYVEDMIIDEHSPTYAERKILVARVPEVERLPTVVPAREPESAVVIQRVQALSRPSVVNQTTSSPIARQEINSVSMRRRKSSRRRIVDLAAGDSPTYNRTNSDSIHLPSDTHVRTRSEDQEQLVVKEEAQPALSETSDIDLGPPGIEELSPAVESQRHEEYRLRVEALRQEFGNNWLHALGEQNFHADHHFANGLEQERSPLHAPANPVIVTGGRSLG